MKTETVKYLNSQNSNSRFLTVAKRLTAFYPWIVILFASLFLFYKYILQVSPSVMAEELMKHFHVNGAGLGNLAATFFYTYLITQLFVGPLLDKFSPKLLTAGAILVSALGALFFANAQTLLDAEVARALIGIGAAFATVSYLKLADIWFKPKQFAFVGGLLATAAMIGSMAGQTPLAYLVSNVGWRSTLYFCSLLGFLFAGLFLLFVKTKTTSSENKNRTNQALSFRDVITVLKQKNNWFLMLYSGLAFSPLAVFGGLWGNPFLQAAHHLSKSEAASLTSFLFLGLAIGGPVLGRLSDKLKKRFEVMFFSLLLSFVSLSFCIYLPNLPTEMVGVLLFLFGFGTGAFMLGFAAGKELNSAVLAATVVGLINTGDALFGAFTEPLVGKFLDTFWEGQTINGVHYFSLHDFQVAFLLLPLYLLAALGCLLIIRKSLKTIV